MTTLTPWLASSWTIASPIPLLPPVTMATLFLNDIGYPLKCPVMGLSALEPSKRQPLCGRLDPSYDLNRTGLLLLRELLDEVCHERGPACLVRGAATAPVLAVKIFMEQDVILEVRIGLELFIIAEDGTPPF